jgi:cyclopropane fatty-acyl-phospholipid synthase-like methyltransferase
MAPSTLAPPTCSDAVLWDTWMSAFHAPTLAIADDLGLFAALNAQPASASELAERVGIEPRAMQAIVGVLAGLALVALADGRFHLTETGRTYLVPESPYYWGPLLRRLRDNPLDCRRLLAILRSGTAAMDAPVTAMWRTPETVPPEAFIAFTHGMHAHSFALAMRTVSSSSFAGARRLLDVGGGSGSWSIAAALHDPELRCAVLDFPIVCGVAREYAERYGVADRIELIPADMFADPWPEGCDRIFFSDIFHDWDDERCRLLAARAYDALPPGGRVLVHEMLLSDTKDGPLHAVSYSMVMVFVTQGRQRSGRELAEILSSAGFSAVTETPTSSGYAILSGTKI